jgi:integrase/recombinase XerD
VLFEGVVDQFSSDLVQAGYMPRTVSLFRNVINRFLASLNLWRYQSVSDKFADMERPQPELTREEYLRLLSAARGANKPRSYLLLKVFGTLGLTVQELSTLTVGTRCRRSSTAG